MRCSLCPTPQPHNGSRGRNETHLSEPSTLSLSNGLRIQLKRDLYCGTLMGYVEDLTQRVRNGTIVLPKRLHRAWANADIVIRDYGNRIALEGPTTAERRKRAIELWRMAAGILKGRKIPDPVRWQRKIRRK